MRGATGKSLLALLLVLAVFGAACTGDDDSDTSADGVDTNIDTDGEGDGDGDSSETSDPTTDSTEGPEPSSNEEAAKAALEDLVVGLSSGDYRSAGRFIVNEGVSDLVVAQLGIAEDEAYNPENLDRALADYCAALDCTRNVNIGPAVAIDELAVTFTVSVEQADGSTETFVIPTSSFEGQYTVGLLPFGSIDDVEQAVVNDPPRTAEGIPLYEGADSPEGWRLGPVGPPALVTLWDRNQVLNSGHTNRFSVIATGDFDEVTYTSSGVVYQEPFSFGSETADDTIWIQKADGPVELVPASTGNDLVVLQGSRFVDWEEDIVYYQVRTGTEPEDTISTLYGVNTLTGDVQTVGIVGGWESGTDFYDIEASYPLVAGMWRGEGFAGPVILNFETGESVYNADQEGASCFVGEGGCPAYWAVTMIDGIIYGVRPPVDSVVSQDAMSLFRFDPNTAFEIEITRFVWDTAVWLPRSMMAHLDSSVIISVEDAAGDPLPAVVVDVEAGLATTLPSAGFVTRSYIS